MAVALFVFFLPKMFPYLCNMETINITLPTSWAELSDKQLLMVYGLFARDLSAAEVKTLCLMKWNGLKVLATLSRHRFLIKRRKRAINFHNSKIIFTFAGKQIFYDYEKATIYICIGIIYMHICMRTIKCRFY